ncbi:1259_t:CDS:1 [Acaulospora colombiana]|uniref:1259_t:CDS:1 n=1 Tax=Acaulospora colombiana TaxID=27376 RepID=A0ACA9K7M4_9GLOM|nr:1259_t:CDS:1 [Acaulospora colombiana]
MIKPIPTECLQEIFEHLQDDECSLFTILQVNRFWCKNVVPILWRNPFELCSKRGGSPNLVETLISCMDIEARNRLKRDCKPLKRKFSRSPPSFNYSSYLRRLTTSDLWEAVLLWVSYKKSCDNIRPHTRTISPDQKMIAGVIKELGLLFNKNCPNFDQLKFNADHDELIGFYLLYCLPHIREFNYSGWGNKERNFDAASKSRNCRNLKKLVVEKISAESKQIVRGLRYGGNARFDYNERYKRRHFSSLFNDVVSSYTNFIDDGSENDLISGTLDPFSISVENPKSERELLLNLIKVQRRLELVKISYSDLNMDFFSSIQTQSRTLSWLEFDTVYFDNSVTLESFGFYENLETLLINACRWENYNDHPLQRQDHSREFLKPQGFSPSKSFRNCNMMFPNLKRLSIRGTIIPSKDLSSIIRNSNKSLTSICLNCQQDIDLPVLRMIIEHCSNVQELEFYLDRKDILECFMMLSGLDSLKILRIYDVKIDRNVGMSGDGNTRETGNNDMEDGGDESYLEPSMTLPKVANFLPKSLRWLSFPKAWVFTLKSLDEFFKNCKVPLQRLELRYRIPNDGVVFGGRGSKD